ncbi:caspase family protein [Bradyrhizobium septentrionale]|uniref:Peptidase C14 caspase domain-containing protein n=1 Tax=Bradyrhizobium septentrionale TaxID=1404411 RepID=A0A973W7Z6_9BRAD|nr:caspase family protein [Bradyrhizobium septentrionale]UGY17975.1 caspase family protein [Bradyrhizobium septentrionale]
MAKAEQVVPSNDKRRDVGLVYDDDSLAEGPATHVLILGIGSYQSSRLKSVSTSVISARNLADWFVDDQKARFSNENCSLGSLAILLSEDKTGRLSTYAGGEVPRATFANAKAAMQAWLDRINTNKDNLAILYVAGHGESFVNRTSFLLEDYGRDKYDATAGMVEVEQLIGSLENAMPVSQLLCFDCCRNPTAADLPWNEIGGNKLIALTRRTDDHGEPRKQWVICSTSLGTAAAGMKDGPTLFNTALLQGLNGVASDPGADGWPVRPGLLFDKIDKILALHRLPDQKPQTPAGRCAGSFDITFPGEFTDVPVYITLKDPAKWPDSTINVSVDGTLVPPAIRGKANQSPFHVRKFQELSVLEIDARGGPASLGSAKAKVRAPSLFITVDQQPVPLRKVRTPGSQAILEIEVPSQYHTGIGGVASITRRDARQSPAYTFPIATGEFDVGRIAIEPGEVTVALHTPDGRIQSRDVTVQEQETTRVIFDSFQSPHEWLVSAVLTGAIHPPSTETVQMAAGGSEVVVEAFGGVGMIRGAVFARAPAIKINHVDDDERYARFDFRDERTRPDRPLQDRRWLTMDRLVRTFEFQRSRPRFPFARITMGRRSELAAIPTSVARSEWRSYALIDRSAHRDTPMTTMVVDNPLWSTLLGFLGSRDMTQSSVLLDHRLLVHAVNAIEDKVANPLAAVAGALIAVSGSSSIEEEWDPWLRNIVHWFPSIPDGPIILGRHLLNRARSRRDIRLATMCMIEGFWRGVPCYSLTVDWLARGLESIPEPPPAVIEAARHARRLANRVDPTRAFTVILER